MKRGVKKLSAEQKAGIQQMCAAGMPPDQAAALFGVSVKSVKRYGRKAKSTTRRKALASSVTDDFFIEPPSLARLMAGR
jgi:DNA-directed RNA polymerase specialized sigma24 family protein